LKELNDLGIAGLKTFNIEIQIVSLNRVSRMVDRKGSQIHPVILSFFYPVTMEVAVYRA
jgi:hypothetical protein